jgi:hypothetical protein
MSGCGRLAKVRKTNERERAPRSRRRSWPRLDSPQRRGLFKAWEVRRRLLAAGLSAFEPDPIGALADLRSASRRPAHRAGLPTA